MGLEDKEFELLLKQKQHNELIKKLDGILKKIAVKDTTLDLSGIETAISKITIKNEIEAIPKSIMALSTLILDKIADVKAYKPLSEWTFDVQRDSEGFIDIVKAKGTE